MKNNLIPFFPRNPANELHLACTPYAYDALEPHIDSKTMEIHHSKHHQTYINNINAGIAGTEWEDLSVEALISKFNEVPEQLRQNVINNAGGHANHSLFWTVMSPDGGGHPEGEIAKAIEHELGGFEAFKEAFTQAALSRFGSGWAWLSMAPDQTLIVESSANQDSPLMHGNIPLLGLDVWGTCPIICSIKTVVRNISRLFSMS